MNRSCVFSPVRTVVLALACCAIGACSTPPPAAESNLRLTEQEQSQRQVLTEAQRAEIRAALATLVADHEVDQLPRTADHGVRWSDVKLAAYYACKDEQMASVRSSNTDNVWVFHLRTANERPGQMVVRRVDDERVYEATVTVGRFHDDDESAARLLKAFHSRMRAFGHKRGFESAHTHVSQP